MKTVHLLGACALLAFGSFARADLSNGQAANLVLGQSDFVTATSGLSQTKFNFPRGVAVDAATGKVFVSDAVNDRVLRFASSASLATGAAAEAVLGQSDFVSGASATAQTGMNSPTGICVDSSGRLWVADRGNHRVLRFESAATKVSGSPADGVLGQVLFTTAVSAAGATGMNGPGGVATNSTGTLWVTDKDNNRVLRFDNAALKANGAAADSVLGQPDFATVTSSTMVNKMATPFDVAISSADVLWVSDQANNRVLRFDGAASLGIGAPANGVLGQTDFVTNTGGTTAAKFQFSLGLDLDSSGALYVADFNNNRVLIFKNAASKTDGANADGVIGQSDFVTSAPADTATGLRGPQGVVLDASGRLYVSQSGSNRVTRYSQLDPTPKITVVGPSTRTTHKASVKLTGTASSDIGILKVQFRVGSKGGYKAAHGTTSWSFKVNKLKFGTTRVTVLATATDGTAATRLLRIKRTH